MHEPHLSLQFYVRKEKVKQHTNIVDISKKFMPSQTYQEGKKVFLSQQDENWFRMKMNFFYVTCCNFFLSVYISFVFVSHAR